MSSQQKIVKTSQVVGTTTDNPEGGTVIAQVFRVDNQQRSVITIVASEGE